MSETVKSESDIEDPTSDASEKAAEDDLAPSASTSKATTANDGTADLDENIIRRLVINFHKVFFYMRSFFETTRLLPSILLSLFTYSLISVTHAAFPHLQAYQT